MLRLRPLLLSALAALAWAGIGLSPADQRSGWDASGVYLGGRTPVEAPAVDNGMRWKPAVWGQANARIIAGGDWPREWWMIWGHPTPDVVWDALDATDWATSRVNRVSPGTNDLSSLESGATWTSTGWAPGASGYIDTPVVPSTDAAVLVAYRGARGQGSYGINEYAAVAGGGNVLIFHASDVAGATPRGRRHYTHGGTVTASPTGATGGVLGVSPGRGWWGGAVEATVPGPVLTSTRALALGARRRESDGQIAWPLGAYTGGSNVRICAAVYWAADPGTAALAAYSAALAERCPQ
jgi:hypothetical protein